MGEHLYCLVSRLLLPIPSKFISGPPMVIMCSYPDPNREIAVAQGWGPRDHSGVFTPQHIITKRWFEEYCIRLDCPWFPPVVRRMATGATVSIQDIQNSYRAHTQGVELPVGSWDDLYKVWLEMKR